MSSDRRVVSDFCWLAVRVAVGLLFAYAGFMKLMEPRANFEAALAVYPLLPGAFIPLVAAVIPWCEWILGMFLILGYAPRISAGLIGLFLLGFLILMASGPLWRGEASGDCGCFGKGGIRISVKTGFFADLGAFILTMAMVWKNRFPWSLDGWLKRK